MPAFYEDKRRIDQRYKQYGQYQTFPQQSTQTLFPPTYNRDAQPGMPQAQQATRMPPMPKAQALELVEKFKRGIVVVSLVGFGTLSVLVLSNTNLSASSTNQATPAANNTANPSDASSTGSDSSSDGIFPQQQGGYGFGSTSSSQGPAARSQNS